jgi:hypothetical protein
LFADCWISFGSVLVEPFFLRQKRAFIWGSQASALTISGSQSTQFLPVPTEPIYLLQDIPTGDTISLIDTSSTIGVAVTDKGAVFLWQIESPDLYLDNSVGIVETEVKNLIAGDIRRLIPEYFDIAYVTMGTVFGSPILVSKDDQTFSFTGRASSTLVGTPPGHRFRVNTLPNSLLNFLITESGELYLYGFGFEYASPVISRANRFATPSYVCLSSVQCALRSRESRYFQNWK